MNESNDLRALWAEYGTRLDQSLRLNEELLVQANLSRSEQTLKPLERGLIFEIACNAVALLLLGSFVADSVHELAYAIPGALLFLAAWLLLAIDVRQLVLLKRIDFDEPVLAIQAAFERLRLDRVRTSYWTIVASPLLWVPLLIVALRSFGMDAYALPAGYLPANLAFALAMIAGGILWAHRATAGGSRLADLLAGRTLSRVRERFDAIERFAE